MEWVVVDLCLIHWRQWLCIMRKDNRRKKRITMIIEIGRIGHRIKRNLIFITTNRMESVMNGSIISMKCIAAILYIAATLLRSCRVLGEWHSTILAISHGQSADM